MPDKLATSECKTCGNDRRNLVQGLKGIGDIEECKKIIIACPDCRLALNSVYIKLTGECSVCGERMETHRRCFLCHILLGVRHDSFGKELKDGRWWCGKCQPTKTMDGNWKDHLSEEAADELLKLYEEPKSKVKIQVKRPPLVRERKPDGKLPDMTDLELIMLRYIDKASSPFDDGNLSPEDIKITRSLYKKHLIDAVPLEGSDAHIDVLFITKLGRRVLGEDDGQGRA